MCRWPDVTGLQPCIGGLNDHQQRDSWRWIRRCRGSGLGVSSKQLPVETEPRGSRGIRWRGDVTHDSVECARSQLFSEPELFVDILARCLGAVTETCVRKVTVQEEELHILATVADGGVDCVRLRCTKLVRKVNEGLETR